MRADRYAIMPRVRRRRALVAVAALSLLPLACHSTAPGSAAGTSTTGARPTPPASHPAPPASTSTTTTTSACDAAVFQGWSLRSRALRVIAAPSMNFNLAALSRVVGAGVGGILFLGPAAPPRNLPSLVAAAQAKPVDGVPVVTMADEEGGGIQRLNGLVASFAWPRQLAAGDTVSQVRSLAGTVGRQLRTAGIDLDLAPVLDVDGGVGPNAQDPDGDRSFSGRTDVATSYGVAFLQGLTAGGELAAVKHFPGLGGSTGNSDVGPAHTVAYDTLKTQALPVFAAAVKAGAPAVMVANDTVPGLSSGPAALSPAVVSGLLRQTLGFHGAVLTDSLSAGAITSAGYTISGAAVAALGAGADFILFGSTLTPGLTAALVPTAVLSTVNGIADAIVAAVQRGTLPESRLNDAVAHVVGLTHASRCPSGSSA